MALETPYIVITIIVITIMVVIALVWIPVVRAPPLVTPPVVYAPASYGVRCVSGVPQFTPTPSSPADFTPQPCASALVCVKVNTGDATGFCKKALGATCDTVSECEPTAQFCINVCAQSTTGGLNQPCSATVECKKDSGLVCSADSVCKYADEAEGCTTSSDCLAGSCQVRVRQSTTEPYLGDDDLEGSAPQIRAQEVRYCAPRHPNGHACSSTYDCLSDHCDGKGFCQAPGMESNTLGAACLYFQAGAPTCPTGASCWVDIQAEPHTYGVCTMERKEWTDESCSSEGMSCIPPTVCYNRQCVMPRTTNSFNTNSCAPSDSSGICSTGFICTAGICEASSPAVPATKGGALVWSLLEWQRSPGIGKWASVVRNIPAPVGLNTFSSFDIGTAKLFIYRAVDGFYFLTPTTTPIRLTIQGPYNGTMLLGQTPATSLADLQFQIDAVRFTPAGRLAISYSWLLSSPTTDSTRVNRVYIQPLPSLTGWDAPLTFQITWQGQTPNTDVTPDSPQQLYGQFYTYGIYGGRPIRNIKWFDVDDRTPDVRFLLIETDGRLSVANTTLADINAVYTGPPGIPFTQPMTDLIWAQYYSFQQPPDSPPIPTRMAFLYISALAPQEIKFSVPPGQLPPAIRLPPTDFPDQTVNRMSLYSPLDGGVARSRMLYLMNYPAEGLLQLRLYDGGDFVLPGHFDTGIQVSLIQRVLPLFMTTANDTYVPGVFVLTTTL